MGTERDNKVVKFHRFPLHINVGMIIFIVIAIYVCVCVVMYFRSKPISGYEVKEGSLSVSNIYTGIAIRDEEIIQSANAGYVNYYAREGEKVACGDLVYTMDQSGRLAELLSDGELGENTLSADNLNEIKSEIIHFQREFDSKTFSSIYEFKYDMEGTSLKLANLNILKSIESLDSAAGYVSLCNAPKSGYVVYNIDGYESLQPSEITSQMFEQEEYEKTQLIGGELVGENSPVYKFITSENWFIVIPIDETRAAELSEETHVKVRFLKEQTESWATAEVLNKEDGQYCVLGFNNSVVSFCKDRYIEIELMTEQEIGLKIPNTAIAEREFFLIPKEYLLEANPSNDTYLFMKETYAEDGTISAEAIELTVYNETDTDYYVDESVLSIGDTLLKYDSSEKYSVSKKGTLIGVYNINKGYADFRQIVVLYANDEYSIVKSNTSYGLSTYDYIVLDAQSVSDDDFIYE